jgi:hypothetical protein
MGSVFYLLLAPFFFLPLVYLVSFFISVFVFQNRNILDEKYQEEKRHTGYAVFLGIVGFVLILGGAFLFFTISTIATVGSLIPCSV